MAVSRKKAAAGKSAAPWQRGNPKPDGEHQTLSPQAKAAAKRRAKRAGRPYPNLVDNMYAAEHDGKKKPPAKKAAAGKSTAKKSPVKKTPPTKDPKGGLTAAGRAEFARKEGAHLKPGVTKKIADMTPEEMRRKGSWAVRFYGRETLPPLQKANGEPTRFALSAHAWGEPVPKTEAQARKIADKGHRLLKRYEAAKTRAARDKEKQQAAARKAREAQPARRAARR